MINENKIRGRIVERGYTLSSFSKEMGLSRVGLRNKLNGEWDFRVSEVERLCELLDISKKDIILYFFTE